MRLRDAFVKTPEDPRSLSKAEKRVASLATHDLVSWGDQCCSDVGRLLYDWSRDAARSELLSEAKLGAEALQVIVAELERRALS